MTATTFYGNTPCVASFYLSKGEQVSLHIPPGRGAMHIQFGDAGKKKFEPTFIKMQDEYHVIRVQEGDGWIDKDTKVTN